MRLGKYLFSSQLRSFSISFRQLVSMRLRSRSLPSLRTSRLHSISFRHSRQYSNPVLRQFARYRGLTASLRMLQRRIASLRKCLQRLLSPVRKRILISSKLAMASLVEWSGSNFLGRKYSESCNRSSEVRSIWVRVYLDCAFLTFSNSNTMAQGYPYSLICLSSQAVCFSSHSSITFNSSRQGQSVSGSNSSSRQKYCSWMAFSSSSSSFSAPNTLFLAKLASKLTWLRMGCLFRQSTVSSWVISKAYVGLGSSFSLVNFFLWSIAAMTSDWQPCENCPSILISLAARLCSLRLPSIGLLKQSCSQKNQRVMLPFSASSISFLARGETSKRRYAKQQILSDCLISSLPVSRNLRQSAKVKDCSWRLDSKGANPNSIKNSRFPNAQACLPSGLTQVLQYPVFSFCPPNSNPAADSYHPAPLLTTLLGCSTLQSILCFAQLLISPLRSVSSCLASGSQMQGAPSLSQLFSTASQRVSSMRYSTSRLPSSEQRMIILGLASTKGRSSMMGCRALSVRYSWQQFSWSQAWQCWTWGPQGLLAEMAREEKTSALYCLVTL